MPGVHRAVIGSNSDLGSWQALAPLRFRRSYFSFGLNEISLYALSGDSGTGSLQRGQQTLVAVS